MQQNKSTWYALLLSFVLIGLLFFSGCVDESNPYNNPNALYVSLDEAYDYTSIQDAIDNAPTNYTVYVLPGHYVGSVLINKTISLIGEDMDSTVIDANHTGDVIKIVGPGKVNVSGFTLINSGTSYSSGDYDAGIHVDCDGNTFSHLNISQNHMGIWSYSSNENSYENLTIMNNSYYGMYLYSSSNSNRIDHSIFYKNKATSGYAIRIKSSKHNVLTNNYFGENGRGLYFCCGARNNIVYHNTFMNNSQWNARDDVGNQWHNGEDAGGNYWGDYNGVDENNDGIGDTSYTISSGNNDPYPLMQPTITYSS